VTPGEGEDGGNDGDARGKTSQIVDLLGQMKDAFMKGALYVILAFVAVGIFFGVKNLLTWIYVRFILQ
jgi:hypothetical protein